MIATATPLTKPLDPMAAVERDFARARAQARRTWALGTALFLAAFLLTTWLSDFFKVAQVTLPDGSRDFRWIIPVGLPKLGDYIEKTIPLLRWESLGA
ncbi:MAG: phosphonate ABC transporter, permease protein PhnE, partial [Rhodobacteraceae bacterium]|nr:phosphonate ABC transporter, permease protein PhnE [Paracoccaceae bacterium]